MPYELDHVSIMTSFDTVDTDGIALGGVAGAAAVEIVHGEAGVRGDLVQALPT